MVASPPRRNAKQEKHDREFNEFLSIRSECWEPVWTQGRILYEEAQALRLQGDHLGVVARFRQILDLQATARATFAELIKGNPNKNPGGACCRAFEGSFEAFVAATKHQLAWPLSQEGCRNALNGWCPRPSQNPERERDIQNRKILAYHQAGGITGYSDTVHLVHTTPYDDYMDGDGYRWNVKPWSEGDLYFALAPPDARGHGYWLTPWGDQVGAMLLKEHPKLLMAKVNEPVATKAPRKAAKPRRKAAATIMPVWIRNARGHIVAGGVPLFPDFLEAK